MKLLQYIFLPVLFANMTLMQNGWIIGRGFFWLGICIAVLCLLHEKHLRTVIMLIGGLVIIRLTRFTLGDIPTLMALAKIVEFLLFSIAGYIVYGDDLQKLRRVVLVLVLANLIVMPFQIAGVSSFFMYWTTDYLHSPEVMGIGEVGTFKNIPVYPTLFVKETDLYYQIGQGRPSGIAPANNLLSTFLLLSAVICLHIKSSPNRFWSSIVMNAAVVLCMSKLAIWLLALIYLKRVRRRGWVLCRSTFFELMTLLGSIGIYAALFPGLFTTNQSANAFLWSIGIRIIDVLHQLNLSTEIFGLNEIPGLLVYRNKDSDGMLLYYLFTPLGITIMILVAVFILAKTLGQKRVEKLSIKNTFYSDYALVLLASAFLIPAIIKSPLFFALAGVLFGQFLRSPPTIKLAIKTSCSKEAVS